MSLDIIIVNWNSGIWLGKCIRSIYNTTSGIDFKIIVIDNSSTDGSCRDIPIGDREVLVRCDSNIGFARACNLGVTKSCSDFLLFLNPDTELSSNAIESAVKLLSKDPSVGIVGVRQVSENGETIPCCSRFLRFKYLINDVTGLSKLFMHRIKSATLMTDWDYNHSSVVNQVMGSFMMMRHSDFIKIGGFDEQFFVYFEDMDLAKRISDIGKNSFYCSNISIIHKGCTSSGSDKGRRLFYSLTSRIKYARKHLGKGEAFLITLITVFPEPFTRIIYYLLFKGSIKDVKDTLKGYFLFSGWLLKDR